MPDLTILDQLVKFAAKVPLTIESGRASVKLTEPEAPGSSVTIVGIPIDAIVIKVDVFRSPDAVFCGTKGECKRADYVIIANAGGKKCILYIEMKRTKGSLKEIINQLRGAKCFIHYCQQIGVIFWNETNFLRNHRHRFVSFGHTRVGKRRTRIERIAPTNDTPEKMMKIDWPYRPQFNRLVGL